MRGLIGGTVALLALCGNAAAMEPETITREAGFPEGPVVVDGALLYAEYGNHRISRWDGEKLTVFWEQDGCGPSAVVPISGPANGGEVLFVTCYDSGSVVRISMQGETLDMATSDDSGAALIGPNDATPDGEGGVWFTSSGPWDSAPIVGRVHHMSADGTVTTRADDLHYANGIVLAGSTLLVAESEAGRVVGMTVSDDGRLTDRRLFVRLREVGEEPGAYPDGMKIGPDGNLWIGQYSSGRIVVVDMEGAHVKTIEVPSPAAPNLAFSEDGSTIYVMAVDDTANPPYTGTVWMMPR